MLPDFMATRILNVQLAYVTNDNESALISLFIGNGTVRHIVFQVIDGKLCVIEDDTEGVFSA